MNILYRLKKYFMINQRADLLLFLSSWMLTYTSLFEVRLLTFREKLTTFDEKIYFRSQTLLESSISQVLYVAAHEIT